MADTPEFSCMIDIRAVDARVRHLEANEAERAALAERFGLVSIGKLTADVDLVKDGQAVDATCTLVADIVQSCAVTGEDLPVAIREKLTFRFVPETGETHAPDDVYENMRAHFSETEAVNLTMLIGAINAWNRIAISFRAIHPVKAKAAVA